jgi:hypothetical protein
MKTISELEETDVSIPSLDPKIWKDFLHKTELDKVWTDDNLYYAKALSNYAKAHDFELMVLSNTKKSHINGYVFRFKSRSQKLAFLLKWA